MKKFFVALFIAITGLCGLVKPVEAVDLSGDFVKLFSEMSDLEAWIPAGTGELFISVVFDATGYRAYRYIFGSTATPNGDTIIQSTDTLNGIDTNGRWIRIETESVADWNGTGRAAVLNKPTTFTPSAHTHPVGSITGLQTALDTKLATPAGTMNQYVRGDGVVQGRSFNYTTRSLDTCFQASATRDVLATYSVDIATSLTLTSGQQGIVYLETFTDSGCTTGVQELTRFVNGQTGTLTVGLSLSQNVTGTLTGVIPAGSYVKLRTENNIGTPTFTSRSAQEVAL